VLPIDPLLNIKNLVFKRKKLIGRNKHKFKKRRGYYLRGKYGDMRLITDVLFKQFFLVPLTIELKRFIASSISKIQKRRALIKVYCGFQSQERAFSAKIFLEYVQYILRRKKLMKINKVLFRIIKLLNVCRVAFGLRGFKFLVAGRFTRRDRATYVWRTKGAVSTSTKLAKIDYAVQPMQMKYSKTIAKL
jgi:hypothetical protein